MVFPVSSSLVKVLCDAIHVPGQFRFEQGGPDQD